MLTFFIIVQARKNVTITVLGPTTENVYGEDSGKYIWHWQSVRQVMLRAIQDNF